METLNPTAAFSALSQQTRLDVFRLLIKAGPEGLLSGEIGKNLKVKQNTMSANLAVLLNSGLIRNERQGRTIRYFSDMDTLRALLVFLMEDCCAGRSERCKPIIDELVCASC